ncbi:MAG: SDR family oxidoreductase [Lentisphaeria bacterium]|jgi:UDP-glucose 4-epimerase
MPQDPISPPAKDCLDGRHLITGGAGFIGSHLAEAILAQGGRVRVFDNLSSGHLENLAPFRDRIEFVQGDLRHPAKLAAAMQGVRYVYHEAALVSVFDSVARPQDNHEINITGTFNLLQAARAAGVQRVLFASTAAAYGNNPALPKRETMLPEPESPYAVAKLTGEHYLRIFHSLYGLETVSLRYFNVYGPRQDPRSPYSGVISKFADALATGQPPTIFGDGAQTRDFVFVQDVVQANLLAMHSPNVGHGEVFNVGTGQPTSLLELLAALGDAFGANPTPNFQPARPGDIRHSLADITRIRATLAFEPRHSLHAGLQALAAASPRR